MRLEVGVCPRCGGTGKSRVFYRIYKFDDIKNKVEKLWEKGMTLREIAGMFGIKHPQTIKNIISR